jgi:hypothetical protein
MGNYVKDLSVLHCDLCRAYKPFPFCFYVTLCAGTVIIDNSPQAFSLQVENGIPIKR